MSKRDVPLAVQDAVRAWAKASDSTAGAKALAAARLALPAELLPILLNEITEISAELLFTMVAKDDPQQAERLGAWAEDQKLTAEALGQSGEAWMREIESGIARYGARERGEDVGAAKPQDAARALSPGLEKLVGTMRASFENRPAAGTSKTAGLSGILSAKNFGKKPKA